MQTCIFHFLLRDLEFAQLVFSCVNLVGICPFRIFNEREIALIAELIFSAAEII